MKLLAFACLITLAGCAHREVQPCPPTRGACPQSQWQTGAQDTVAGALQIMMSALMH